MILLWDHMNQITYCIILLGIVFYFIGIIIPTVILLYVIWNIFLFFIISINIIINIK